MQPEERRNADPVGCRVNVANTRAQRIAEKARTRDSLHALSKLAQRVDGKHQIVSQPPMIVPLREVAASRGVSHTFTEAIRSGRLTHSKASDRC